MEHNTEENRLSKAEYRLDTHEKHLQHLIEGVDALVKAEVRRENDKETFGRIFDVIKIAQDDIATLKRGFEEYKKDQAEKELVAYKTVVWKVVGMGMLVAASVFVGHFGAHLLG